MKTVLVPTDYSSNAGLALQFALTLHQKSPIKVLVFHWVEILIPTSTAPHTYSELYRKEKEIKLSELQAYVQTITAALPESSPEITGVLKDSYDFDESLAETIRELAVDMVILGTRGNSGLTQLIFGSHTTRILEKSEVPVVVIPPDYTAGSVKTIAYASDLKDVVTEVAALVAFARFFDADLEIFHVYPSFPQWIEVTQENMDKVVADLRQAYPDQRFQLQIIQMYKDNDIVNGVKRFVSSYKPDMLAMFTVKRSFWDKLFDTSKTEELAFSTHIPLITLKKA